MIRWKQRRPWGFTREILDNLKIAKEMTMDEKIAFWQEVMRYGHDRGLEFHIITWNIFVWGAAGKYGITDDVGNETTIDYIRKSVFALFDTYPLLAGIGVTAGEHMQGLSPDTKEQWLWRTYGEGVMDASKAFPERRIRFIHRYWMSDIPEIAKHFKGFSENVQFDFSFKYVKARLYASTDPGFADKVIAEAPEGTRWWWNLRNDDIFYFRWGDPDFVREFICNVPGSGHTEGFHLGSDGYVWGREFVSRDPAIPRQLEIDKHWYSFMLWGRLGYDPTVPNSCFENAIAQRFSGKTARELFTVWARASKIIPAVNRFHWHDWDFQWAIEGCRGRDGYHAITAECWHPGGKAVAKAVEEHAQFVLTNTPALIDEGSDKEWDETVHDLIAMAHLGNYYSEKIRAADFRDTNPEQAILHLKNAADHWLLYAKVAGRQYTPQLLSKGGWVDWMQGYENALNDIELLKANPDGQRLHSS